MLLLVLFTVFVYCITFRMFVVRKSRSIASEASPHLTSHAVWGHLGRVPGELNRHTRLHWCFLPRAGLSPRHDLLELLGRYRVPETGYGWVPNSWSRLGSNKCLMIVVCLEVPELTRFFWVCTESHPSHCSKLISRCYSCAFRVACLPSWVNRDGVCL